MGAFTYPRSEPGSGGHQDLIERLNANATALRSLLDGVPEHVLAYRPAEGEWSIKEVVGHLWVADDIWYRRLYQVCSLTDPVLMRWAGEEEALARAYEAPDVRPLLAELATRRQRIVDLLSNAIDWTRTGQWLGEGRRSLKQLAEYLVSHDADHIGQVQALKSAQLRPAVS